MGNPAYLKRPYMVSDLSSLTDEELDDTWDKIDLRISEMKREDEALRARLAFIQQEFKDRFAARGTDATRTNNRIISLQIDDKYVEVYDKQAFNDYIINNKALFLLQQRPAVRAIAAELAFRKAIPGVKFTQKETLSRRSRPKKR